MPLFTARARPRQTRLSASSTSSFKKREQLYMYLYILAVALLLVISVSILQLDIGGSPADTAHDAKHARKGARGTEDLRVNRHKGEFGAAVRRENYRDTEKVSMRNRPEVFHSGIRSKDWKARGAPGKKRFENGWTEEEEEVQEVGSGKKGAQLFSDIEGREEDGDDTDDLEERGHTEKSRTYQEQQLDDMDKFDRDEVREDAYKQQGQLLDDMDKFDNRQVTEDTNRYVFQDDAVPTFVEERTRNRKYQMVGSNHPESQAKGQYMMTEVDTRLNRRDGKKESRKLGYGGEIGRDVLIKGQKDEEQEDSGQLGLSTGDPSVSDERAQPANAIRQTPTAPKVSLRSAIEQELEKENGVFTREAREFLRRILGETNFNITLSHVKINSEKTDLEETGATGTPSFKEFSDDMKASYDNDNEPVDINVVRKDLKSEDPLIVDKVSLQADKSTPSDTQMRDEGVIVDSFNLPNVTDKRLIKEDQWAHVDDTRNEAGKEIESRSADEDNPDVEENEVDGEPESRKTNENDSAVKKSEDKDHDNLIQWGFYPNLSTTLKFSKFLSAFFKQENCSLRIFMAWTTAPWAYTPRHQRAIESILHFHPQACIVVFTETVDFKFFDSWVKEGFKIAVARPNLEELLGKTPAIDFAYVWYEWRNMNLFYIHYTELLRIAALHKYGGVWLDMDIILARPLPKLHNVLGSTVAEDGEWVLNGAFMSFDKSSSFLKACIEEYVAKYDETSLGWNGADLLNRVASNATQKGGKVWLEQPEHLQVLEPAAFFPLSRHNIIKYFSAPNSDDDRVEQKKLLSAILHESHGTHLWNSVTGRLVPEVGSLVEKLLNRFCMRCTDVL